MRRRSGRAVLPEYVDPENVPLDVLLNVRVKAADAEETTATTTEEPTTTSTEEPTTTSTEAPTTAATTQAPAGSMTDTEAPTTAATTATTTEAPDNSDSNVKTGDNTPINIMVVLMLVSGIGMLFVAKRKSKF